MLVVLLLVTTICAYLIPLGVIANSKRTRGHEKNIWLMATLIFSWVALLLYVTVVPPYHKQTPKRLRRRASA
ncbi:hypothetical protein [Pseudoalteromonas xiamenensis]|uniref:hypothetical protein n=1 Tax=Pseudoalteromonas xiamenensis TaxID=882626 RepID=UPI0035EBA764